MLNKHCIFFCLFLFFRGHPKITLRCFEGAPFCLSLESKARRMACLFHTSGKMVPRGTPPSDTTSARSPLAVLFCSAPPLGCGSVHVLDGSFARFCVSENVRVPLRYSGQPLHRKIIASRSPNTPWFCLSNRFFANFNQAIDYKSIYADSWGPENNASDRNGGDRKSDRRRFSYSRFSVFAAWRQQSLGEVALCS